MFASDQSQHVFGRIYPHPHFPAPIVTKKILIKKLKNFNFEKIKNSNRGHNQKLELLQTLKKNQVVTNRKIQFFTELKTQIATKPNNSNLNKFTKNIFVIKLKILNCDKTKKNQIVTNKNLKL